MRQTEIMSEKATNKAMAEVNKTFDELNKMIKAKINNKDINGADKNIRTRYALFKKIFVRVMMSVYEEAFFWEVYYIQTALKKYGNVFLTGKPETRKALKYISKRELEYINKIKLINNITKTNKTSRRITEDMVNNASGKNGDSGATYNLMRIYRTESNRTQNMASISAYNYMGIKYYRYKAELDSKTCEDCQNMDGKIFSVDEAMSGKNLPPMHPNCRCYIEPVLDDIERKLSNTRFKKIEYGTFRSYYTTKHKNV